MPHKYVLYYFPVTGMAESIRLAFELKGVRFADVQIPFPDWPDYKEKADICPLGQVPTLQVDGIIICQHLAIARYVAHELDMYGSTSMEKAYTDQVLETSHEIFQALEKIMADRSLNIAGQTTAYAKYFEENKAKLEYMQKIFDQHAGDYFLGTKIGIADLYYYAVSEYMVGLHATALDPYPSLKGLRERIMNKEPLKSYIKNRKQQVFIPSEFV